MAERVASFGGLGEEEEKQIFQRSVPKGKYTGIDVVKYKLKMWRE